MKAKLIISLLALFAISLKDFANSFINLTPWPKSITRSNDTYSLPSNFTIGGQNLPDSIKAEIHHFTEDFNNASTGYYATEDYKNSCNVKITFSPKIISKIQEKESYTLSIKSSGINIESCSATGVYYAFATIKKLLPANISIGVTDEKQQNYSLPCVEIIDEPVFGYRGFMLDCSRHFFDITEIKRMLDIMSVYKMNRFHWHLTDDQGWRAEIKKYPKLTTIGATAPNCWLTDLHEGTYWTNRKYGPYYYTQEEMREIVTYAKKRHIEIVPEIEFPGHSVAALAAYPEFSCNPEKDEPVWITGGVSRNVLNVGNPKAIEFVKDILTEIMDIFPYEFIHIGGDECPIDAWKQNIQCQELYKKLNLSHYRALQSHFNKEVADFIGKRGRRIATWNESIDCEGADTELMKTTNATIWCWTNAYGNAKRAAKMGLDAMLTPWTRGYINRTQSNDPVEKTLPGDGSDNVKNVYKINPFEGDVPEELRPHYIGIQGTFWTEHIGTNDMMEHMALPRLLCIAEVGWTPYENKDFSSFQKRLTADTLIFNYGKYEYAKHYIIGYKDKNVVNQFNKPSSSKGKDISYYRIMTCAGGPRSRRCMELIHEGSSILTTYEAQNAAVNRLWTNNRAEKNSPNYDWQLWRLEEDKNNPGKYALVCKALPNGSLYPNASANDASARFNYDTSHKHYNFELGTGGKGNVENVFYGTITSTSHKNNYLNASMEGQGFSVNLYNSPKDGNGGLWYFIPANGMKTEKSAQSIIKEAENIITYGKTYTSKPALHQYSKKSIQQLKNALYKAKETQNLNGKDQKSLTGKIAKKIFTAKKSLGQLQIGKCYRFNCSIDGYQQTTICDDGVSNYIQHSIVPKSKTDFWIVTQSSTNAEGNQCVRLRNVQTHRYLGNNSNQYERAMWPISSDEIGQDITIVFNPQYGDYTLSINGKNLFPLSESAPSLPNVLSSGNCNYGAKQFVQAVRLQGAAWNIEEVNN